MFVEKAVGWGRWITAPTGVVLAAFPFNQSGMALYERVGFSTVGVYREQGQLDGQWVDVIVMEKLL